MLPNGDDGMAASLEHMRTLTYVHHGVTVHEHRFAVPLDHFASVSQGSETIEVFARELVRDGGERLPHLVFLQGGPGGQGPRQGDLASGWIGAALKDYRVVLLDQRGTGLSTRLDAQSLADLPSDQARADRVALFRQDQIIADAEVVREELTGGAPWTTLGQSYGGFLTLTYLSMAPQGVAASMLTGGLPGLVGIDDIYHLTYERTAARNRAHFARHPEDEQTIREVCAHLRDTEERLPTGERLSPTRFRMIGMGLGMQTRTDLLHYLLEGPWVSVRGEKRLSEAFLDAVWADVQMAPMYGVLQESIYAGATPALVEAAAPTNWSAERLARHTPGFVPDADPLDTTEPYYLTGEHMMRAVFEEDPHLRPLLGTTDLLAERTDWRPVYLPEVLAQTSTPVTAAVYYDDMFVPRELSLDTAAQIRGARVWVTNEYQHDGVRASGGRVFERLHAMLTD